MNAYVLAAQEEESSNKKKMSMNLYNARTQRNACTYKLWWFLKGLCQSSIWVKFFNFDKNWKTTNVKFCKSKATAPHRHRFHNNWIGNISNWLCHVVCFFKWFNLNQNVYRQRVSSSSIEFIPSFSYLFAAYSFYFTLTTH